MKKWKHINFEQRKNKLGQYYGWPVAVYTIPEYITDYDNITSKVST